MKSFYGVSTPHWHRKSFHTIYTLYISVYSEYSDEELSESEDIIPETRRRSIKHQRCTATTHLLRKPVVRPVSSSAESSDTEYYSIPTARMYFEKKKNQKGTMIRHSTALPLSQPVTDSPLPNISAITLCDKTMVNEETSTLTDTTPQTTISTSELPSRHVEGQSKSIPNHSTPTDKSDATNTSKCTFNATGHTNCANHKNGCDRTTSRQPFSCRSQAGSVTSNMTSGTVERFCDCESVLRCGYSLARSKMESISTQNLKYLGSL